MFLLGQFNHNIDEKNRLTIPSKLREQLETGSIYISKSFDNCLEVRDKECFIVWTEKLNKLSAGKKEARALKRQIMAQSEDTVFDSAGRIKISKHLLGLVGITKEVVIIGNIDRIELWSPDSWKKYQESNSSLEDYADLLGDSL